MERRYKTSPVALVLVVPLDLTPPRRDLGVAELGVVELLALALTLTLAAKSNSSMLDVTRSGATATKEFEVVFVVEEFANEVSPKVNTREPRTLRPSYHQSQACTSQMQNLPH